MPYHKRSRSTKRSTWTLDRHDVHELFICLLLAGIFVLLSSGALFAQGNVGINNPAPHGRALLDLTSTDKGLLVPRMTEAERLAMFPAPDPSAKGMLVYQNDAQEGFHHYDGAAWIFHSAIPTPAGWQLGGNAGTNMATDLLGTTDNTGLVLATNGLERLRIAPNGNVGLGTAVTNVRLHVAADQPDVLSNFYNANAAGHAGVHFDNNAGGRAHTGFGGSAATLWGNVGYSGTSSAHPFVLTTSNVERMRIAANGFVGIGTTTPGRRLDVVEGGTGLVARFQGTNPNTYSVVHWLRSDNVGAHVGFFNPGLASPLAGNFLLGTYGNAPVSLTTNDVERVRITETGSVGIGLATPAHTLHVQGSHPTASLGLRNTDNTAVSGTHYYGGGGTLAGVTGWANGAYPIASGTLLHGTLNNLAATFITNSNERMRITANGHVGIGTTAPLRPFHVEGVHANGGLGLLRNNDANGWSGLDFVSNDASALAFVGFNNEFQHGYIGTGTNNAFRIFTNGFGRVTVAANGDVGIGTGTPGRRLDVVDDNSGLVARFQGTNPNAYSMVHWLRSDNVGAHVGFFNPGLASPLAGNFLLGTFGNAPLSLTTNDVERVRIATNGHVGIGTASPSSTLEVNGFTKLGSDAPAVRMKKLTATTAATEGGYVDIVHGVTASKILSVEVLIEWATGSWISDGYTLNAEYQANFVVNGTAIRLLNHTTNSGNILSRPVKLLITYEQ